MLSLSRDNGANRGRGRGGSSSTTLTLDLQQQKQQSVLRSCRITMAVDVSGSMEKLINAVIKGIAGINSVLNDQDYVSVIDFAEDRGTIFPYLKRSKVDWTALGDTLKSHVKESNRGVCTALWDAIGYVLKTTPRNVEYRQYKPEIVIFTDGKDNDSSEYDNESIRETLEHPGIPHVHITIIDASKGGNSELKKICAPIQHCSFVQVKASQEAIQRAFVDVVTAITTRLTITIESNDATDALISSLNQLAIGSKALPPATDGGNRGGRSRGRGRGRGRAQ